MSKKEITIICEHCENIYFRPVVGNFNNQRLVLDYSVCPHCGTARFPHLIAKYEKKDMCVECGIPNMLIGNRKAAKEMCWRCYRIGLRNKKHI